jgi:hypothetical protein
MNAEDIDELEQVRNHIKILEAEAGGLMPAGDGDITEESNLNEVASSVDDDSSGMDGLSETTEKDDVKQQQCRPQTQLAGRETTTLRRLKLIVFFLLLCAMVAVSLTAYYFTAKQEDKEFQDQYYEDANKVMSTLGSNLERTLQASDAFVASITSCVKATNQTWPYVVIPDFAVRAEKIRSLANAVYVNTFHLVQPEERYEWQNFTAQTGDSWINESVAVIENYADVDYWDIIWNYTSWNVIWEYDEFDKENPGEEGVTYDGPYLPFWQVQPAIPSEPLYNWCV